MAADSKFGATVQVGPVGVIQSANVFMRSKPAGSPHATTENAPILASGAAVSPTSAPPKTISSVISTPVASDPTSTCTARAQYIFGLGDFKANTASANTVTCQQMPNTPPASDTRTILQNASSDSDAVIPNNLPRSSTPTSLEGKYPNHTSVPPPTSLSTFIPATAGPFPAQRLISKNPKVAVVRL
ncbi:hypothetical protein MMC31_001755 [Peltigera leucophlebia]|nr:hypothetical protein [Peltigera leucophlebia]